MNGKKFAVAAVLLWLFTVVVAAWFFIRGTAVSGTDNRTAIVLQTAERESVLREMRSLLSATQGILEGVNQGDISMVSKSARSVGMAAAVDANPSLMAKLPLSFKKLGMSVHRSMDDLADAADLGASTSELLKKLSGTLSVCVACHSAWQLKAVQ